MQLKFLQLSIIILFIFSCASSNQSDNIEKYEAENLDNALLEEVKKGGYILLMRHGKKESKNLISYKDKLSDEGIEASKSLNKWIKKNNVKISHIYRTHAFRTQETSHYVYDCEINKKWINKECTEQKEDEEINFNCYPDEIGNCATLDLAEINFTRVSSVNEINIETLKNSDKQKLKWEERLVHYMLNIPEEYLNEKNVAIVAHRNINFAVCKLIGNNNINDKLHLEELSTIVIKPYKNKLIVKGLLFDDFE